MRVRFSKEFHKDSAEGISRDESPEHHPGKMRLPGEPFLHYPDQDKQRDPFQESFIQLGRMPASRTAACCIEDHAPRDFRRATIELAVDEIAESSEPQANWGG